MAAGTGLEQAPSTLKCRDTLSVEVKGAASRDFHVRVGSCLLIPHSFVILFDFASKAWVGGRKEVERGPWTKRKGWRGGG